MDEDTIEAPIRRRPPPVLDASKVAAATRANLLSSEGVDPDGKAAAGREGGLTEGEVGKEGAGKGGEGGEGGEGEGGARGTWKASPSVSRKNSTTCVEGAIGVVRRNSLHGRLTRGLSALDAAAQGALTPKMPRPVTMELRAPVSTAPLPSPQVGGTTPLTLSDGGASSAQGEAKKRSSEGTWRRVFDAESGDFYFWHTSTRETTWEKPADFVAPEEAPTAVTTKPAAPGSLPSPMLILRVHINVSDFVHMNSGTNFLTMKFAEDAQISDMYARIAKKLRLPVEGFSEQFSLLWTKDKEDSIFLQPHQTLKSYELKSLLQDTVQLVKLSYQVSVVDLANVSTSIAANFFDNLEVNRLLDRFAQEANMKPSELFFCRPSAQYKELELGKSLNDQAVRNNELLVLKSRKKKKRTSMKHIRRSKITPRKKTTGNAVFGQSLESLMSTTLAIPSPVHEATMWLRCYGMDSRSLFLNPVDEGEVQRLKSDFDTGSEINLDAGTSPYVVARLLLLFFEELPSRVIPARVLSDLTIEKGAPIKEFEALPRVNLILLCHMAHFFNHTSVHSAKNMMKVDKIASVFGRVLVDDYERHMEAAHAVISHITACPKAVPYTPSNVTASYIDSSSLQVMVSSVEDLKFLPGEEAVANVARATLMFGTEHIPAEVLCTTYKLLMRSVSACNEGQAFNVVDFDVPLTEIKSIERKAAKERDVLHVNIECTRFRKFTLLFRSVSDGAKLLDALSICSGTIPRSVAFANVVSRLMLRERLAFGPYSLENEFARQGARVHDLWRLWNTKNICKRYPGHMVIPMSLSDDAVLSNATHYRNRSIPVLVYHHKRGGSVLLLSGSLVPVETPAHISASFAPSLLSRTQMGESTRNLLGRAGSDRVTSSMIPSSALTDSAGDTQDPTEELIGCYRSCTGSESLHFIALGTAKSGPHRTGVPFMNIEEQYNALRDVLGTPITRESVLAARKTWLASISEVLINSLTVALTLEKGDSIMLEDDSFFHYIVSSLAMLMLDPFYRTIAGFRTLIDHVWRHSNFPFSKATGIGSPVKTQSFVHFLDCVWQIWHQMPSEFEISEDLLVFLGRNLSSGRYGTFLGNTWEEHVVNDETLLSVWNEITGSPDRFKNPFWDGKELKSDVLRPDASVNSLCIWGGSYCAWMERTHLSALLRRAMDLCKTSTSLGLRRSCVSSLPYSFRPLLRKVSYLSLEKSGLTSFPLVLLFAPNLENLNLSGNAIGSVSSHTFDLMAERLPNLTVLNLRSNAISSVKGIGKLTSLVSLTLAENPIGDVSGTWNELQHLTAIEVLNLNEIAVAKLPEWLCARTALRTLSIENGHIKKLPEDMKQLHALAILSLAGNMVETVPSSFSSLRSLKSVNFSDNRLMQFPEAFLSCGDLKQLLLGGNRIPDVPQSIVSCVLLNQLDLSNNKISHLPLGLGELDIKDLRLNGNVGLPAHLKAAVQSGNVLSVLRDELNGDIPLRRMRVMMVGQENVGKTTVWHLLTPKQLRALRKEKAHAGEENISTDGIDINTWDMRVTVTNPETGLAEETTVNISAWDFAGQELYYDTHQLFMSERSVYLLVWNIMWPEQESRIEFWLQSVNARTHSPVILVATHLDDPGCTKDYFAECMAKIDQRYGERFPNIRAILGVSCSSGKGIAELRHCLREVIGEMPQIHERVSNKVILLEKELAARRKSMSAPVMSWSQYTEVARNFGLKEDVQLTKSASVLHLLGSIVHFNEEVFRDLVILDSSWLTNLVASIITTKHRYVKDGVLKHADLPQIWRPPEFPAYLHTMLRKLLQRFEVIYELQESESETNDSSAASGEASTLRGRSLVPCMLPLERPKEVAEIVPRFPKFYAAITEFRRQFYFNFVPHGLISHLIIRIISSAPGRCFWRHGVVADTETSDLILLELTPEKNELTLVVRGSDSAQAVFVKVVDLIDSFITDWFRLDVKTLIPCPHCMQERSFDPYLFTLDFCRDAAMRGEFYLLCNTSNRSVRLDMLVPEVSSQTINKVEFNAIDVEKQVGKGGFATVFRAKLDDEVVAVKRFDILPGDGQKEAYLEFMREVWIMSGIHNPYVVQFKGLCTNPLCIITDFAQHGNLYDFLHDNSNRDKSTSLVLKYKIAFDIAQGMRFLHNRTPPVVHGDLKSPNILLVSTDITKQVVARVADFGLSRMTGIAQKGRKVDNPVWLAPEILSGKDYNEKADVYAYGVILFEILTLQEYSQGYTFMSALEDDIMRGKRPPLPSHADPEVKSLISDCWDNVPAARPTFDLVLQRISVLLFSLTATGKTDEVFVVEEDPGGESGGPAADDITASEPEQSHVNRSQSRTLVSNTTGVRFDGRGRHASSAGCQPYVGDVSFIQQLTPVHDSAVHCLTIANDNELLWAGCQDGTIHSWSAKDMQHLRMYPAHTGVINCMVLVGDEVWSCSSEDCTVRIWNAREGRMIRALYPGLEMLTLSVVGEEVWGGTPSGTIMTWQLDGERSKRDFTGTSGANLKDIALQDLAQRMAHKMTGLELRSHKLRFKSYASCFTGADVVAWLMKRADCKTEDNAIELAQKLIEAGYLAHVLRTATFRNSKKVFYRLANVGLESGFEAVLSDKEDASGFTCKYSKAVAETGAINCILYDPSTSWVWLGTDRSIVVLDSVTLQLIMCLRGHSGMINALVCVGDTVWSGSNDTNIHIWDRETGDMIRRLTGHTGPVMSMLVEDADHVWSAGADRSLILWNSSGEFEKEVKGRHEQGITDVALRRDADGGVLFTSSLDCYIRTYHAHAWDVRAAEASSALKRGELKEDLEKKKKGRLSMSSKLPKLKSTDYRLSFPQQTIDAIKRLTGEKINFVQLVMVQEGPLLTATVRTEGKVEASSLGAHLFDDQPMYNVYKYRPTNCTEDTFLLILCTTPGSTMEGRLSHKRHEAHVRSEIRVQLGHSITVVRAMYRQRSSQLGISAISDVRPEQVTESYLSYCLRGDNSRPEDEVSGEVLEEEVDMSHSTSLNKSM